MIRLFLLLAATAVTSAQPQLHRLTISNGTEDSVVPTFDLTGGPADLVLTVAASVAGGEVAGISITMTAPDYFGGQTQLVVPSIQAPQATTRYPLPRFLQTGTYRLNVAVIDTRGHSRRWTADELIAAGLPYRFEVRAPGDFDGPAVDHVDIAPIADPAQPRGVARVTVRDPSGVIAYRVVAVSPSGRRVVLADYQAGVGVGPTHTFETPFDLSTGARLDGAAEEGRWLIAEIHLTDSNGTSRVVTGRDLSNLDIQSRLSVGEVPPEENIVRRCGSPNPVTEGGTVHLSSSAEIYDARGRRVGQATTDGDFVTAGLSRGVYLARRAESVHSTCRFTVAGQ